MVNSVGLVAAWGYVVIAAVLGLAIGSAVNALVWRMYVGKSWVHGRSECPECGHRLATKDLVPVLSWLSLGGKCRYCKKPIKDSPVVEIACGVLFAASAWLLAPMSTAGDVRLGFWLAALVLLLALAVYDLRWMILPDKLTLPLIGLALVGDVVLAVMLRSPQMLLGPVEAAVLAGGGFFALVAGSKGKAMGGGDIKLAAAMGLLLGLRATGLALVVAFCSAALVGLGLIAAGRRSRKDQIPFGPFLVGGTVVAFWFGQAIVDWYLRLNGLG